MGTLLWSSLIYGVIGVVWLTVELTGLARRRGLPVPWFTLSETVWALEKRLPVLRALIALGGLDVIVHLVAHTPLWP